MRTYLNKYISNLATKLLNGVVILLLLCGLPQVGYAVVVISEIMYAVDGADEGHEWVEVCNLGTEHIDLSTWFLYEQDTEHGIHEYRGGPSLASHVCGIVADNADMVAVDLSAYQGPLFDTAFGSLSDTGEQLALHNTDHAVQDDVTYSSDSGAKGDGNTLHRVSASEHTFVGGAPTPGAEPALLGSSNETTTTGNMQTVTIPVVTQYEWKTVEIEPPQDIYLRVPDMLTTHVGSMTQFFTEVYDARGTAFDGGIVTWNFGDGVTYDGRDVTHIYQHVGTYTVHVRITSGTLRDEHDIRVTVVPPQVALSVIDDATAVALTNESDAALDISVWRIHSGSGYFVIPENTMIAPQATIVFDNRIMKLFGLGAPNQVRLVVPSGDTIVTANEQAPAPDTNETVLEEEVPLASEASTERTVNVSEITPVPYVHGSIVGTTLTVPVTKSTEAIVVAEEALSARIDPETPNLGTEQYMASAFSSGVSVPWWAALVGLMGVGLVSAFVYRPRRSSNTSPSSAVPTTDVYEVREITEKF